MGNYLMLILTGVSLVYGVTTMRLHTARMEQDDKASRQYSVTQARNCATSAMEVGLSKVSVNNDWNEGIQNIELNGATASVTVHDHTTDNTLSPMEKYVRSAATFSDATQYVDVHCGLPPNIADIAIYATEDVTNISKVVDKEGQEDNDLLIANAPFMVEFDYDAMYALAEAQGHVYEGDFKATKDYPNGSFYYDTDVPNITKVEGDFDVPGGRIVYGIFIVEGQIDIDVKGSARVEGIILVPTDGEVEIRGGGPKYVPYEIICGEESGNNGNGNGKGNGKGNGFGHSGAKNNASVTGGIIVNGSLGGKGNHITVQHNPCYMVELAKFQLKQSLYILSWTESPAV